MQKEKMVGIIKKNKERIIEIIFFFGIFFVSINPLVDFDIWFHLKSGEIISKLGIIHHDVFAYTTAGREWIPYEWLFQLTTYLFVHLFGLNFLIYLIAALSTLFIFITYLIFRKILFLNIYQSLVICFLLYSSIYELLNPRPQIFAYIFFATNLFFILLYYLRNKNLLWLTIPVTFLWANTHGSIFIDVGLFGMYAVICLLNKFIFKEKIWLTKFKLFSFYFFLTLVLTILPPLGIIQYKLLWIFYENRATITRFISEWAPLSADLTPFLFYSFFVVLVLSTFSYSLWINKNFKKILWLIPFIFFIFSPFLAVRNTFYGYFGMSIIIAYSISKIKFSDFSKKMRVLLIFLLISVLIFFSWLLYDKKISVNQYSVYYPTKAVKFIKDYNLKGNMFNEYGYGGYLLYELYPQQKVYFDGRSDLYLCCEMPDTLQFSYYKRLPNDQYKKILDRFWNKNKISFVILRTEKDTVLRKIESILQNDPDWSLVFWDDVTIIFVRKDGKNNKIIEKFGTKAATPYEKIPFRQDQEELAFNEYLKMNRIADSSKTRNTLGYIHLLRNEYDKAQFEFEKAIQIFPSNESPYMNLAEIYLKNGYPDRAIELYQAAKNLAPDRGLIYIRLGQITNEVYKDRMSALEIWKEGVKNTTDNASRKQLINLIQAN